MGSMNPFGQAVPEIFLNNYLKSNLENSIFLKKSPLFRTLNANISRTAYDEKIIEPILKSSR